MADWEEAHWNGVENAPTFGDRRGGRFLQYVPDKLCDRPLIVAPDIDELASSVERRVRSLSDSPGNLGLEALARFLLRSEAIASSRIEGLQVSAQQVGLAEIIDEEGISGARPNTTAQQVAANISSLRRATEGTAALSRVTIGAVEDLQRVLIGDADHHDLRTVTNWIGGSSYTPIGAEFVPPPYSLVPELMADLVAYLNGGSHAPLVQAGLVHAQFETIHPFKDGNGRVGRALVHTALVRRGLTRRAVLPISPVLLTRSQQYVGGLTAYRYQGAASGPEARQAVSDWLRVFLEAVDTAVDQAVEFAQELLALRESWAHRVTVARSDRGLRATPRADSAGARLLENLQESPVLTATSAARLLDISAVAAKAALDELTDAGVLRRRRIDGRTTGYLAMDVFELLTLAERRLASTRWDTRESSPVRAAPFRP